MKLLITTLILSLISATSYSTGQQYENNPISLTDEQQQEVNEYINQEYLAQEAERACEILRKELSGEDLSASEQSFYNNLSAEEQKAYTDEVKEIEKNARTGGGRFQKEGFDPCNASNEVLIGAVFGETGDQIIEMAAKAYSTVMGMSSMGGGNKIDMKTSGYKTHEGVSSAKESLNTARDQKTTTDIGKKAKEENISNAKNDLKDAKADRAKENTEEKNDLCAYIPMATETIGTVTLQAKANNLESDQIIDENQNAQQESFFKMARMQDARKTTANIQALGWGSTAVCYVGYMAGGAVVDTKLIAKTAASALLGTYYRTKAKRHERAKAYFNFMGTKFANMKGKCHPITDKQCYCSLKSNENLPMCLPAGMANRGGSGIKQIVSCIDSKMQSDPDCSCYPNNCFDVKYKKISGYGQFGNTAYSSAMDSTSSLFSGGFDEGYLENATNKQLAMTKRYLKKIEDKMPANLGRNPLTPQQKTMAQSLVNDGYPPAVAGHMASLPINAKGQAALSKWKNDSNANIKQAANYALKNPGKVVMYGAANTKGKKSSSGDNYQNPFAQFLKKKKSNDNTSGEILSFAQKAEGQAQIEKDSGRVIFDIISHRYRMSAWQKFKVLEMKNSEK